MGIKQELGKLFGRRTESTEQPAQVVRILEGKVAEVLGSKVAPSQFVSGSCRLNVIDEGGAERHFSSVGQGFYFKIDEERVDVAGVNTAPRKPDGLSDSFIELRYPPKPKPLP